MKAIAACVVIACTVLWCACGPFGGTPSAQDILSRPGRAGLRDAHLAISGTPGQGMTDVLVTGQGDIVFSPRLAYHLAMTTSIGGVNVASEVLSVDGSSYQRSSGGRWLRSPVAIMPSSFVAWSGAGAARLVGEEAVAGSRCWHVGATTGGIPLDLWVREADGFPVRAQVGQLVVDYSRFNSGVKIAAPPASAVQPQGKSVTVTVGQAAHLNGVDVTVPAADLNYRPANRALRPRPGDRFVLAEVDYLLTGADRVSYGPVQWRLTDVHGADYQPAFLDREPRLGLGDLTARGQQARGFLSYEAPAAAAGLRLQGAIGGDTVTITLG